MTGSHNMVSNRVLQPHANDIIQDYRPSNNETELNLGPVLLPEPCTDSVDVTHVSTLRIYSRSIFNS